MEYAIIIVIRKDRSMLNKDLFLTHDSLVDDFVQSFTYPYEVLSKIESYIIEKGKTLGSDYLFKEGNIWIHKSAKVDPSSTIIGPCIIDRESEIRPHAYIRGKVVVGKRCVIGNSSELKNTLLYDDVQVPHFNYVGDSILGSHAHLGAGSIISNLKSDKTDVVIKSNPPLSTNLRKVGAFLGDYVEVGCNCVLNPGTVVGVHSTIYPLTSVRGVIPPYIIMKDKDTLARKEVLQHG